MNTANNQIVGQSYDANGNTSYVTNGGLTYNLYYDAENRLSSVYYSPNGTNLEYYGYDAQNRRIWNWPGTLNGSNASNYTVNVYSPAGQKLAAYQFVAYTSSMTATLTSSEKYFGGRRLATLDRLGSAGNAGVDKGIYFPWGEAKGTPNPQDTWNFATYWQDSLTGLDYANNRYYSNTSGSFMTPDPHQGNSGGTGDPNNPQNWNRYAYTAGDPVNRVDPGGKDWCSADFGWDCDFFGDGTGDVSEGCLVGGACAQICIDAGLPTSFCDVVGVGVGGGGSSGSGQPFQGGTSQTCPTGQIIVNGACVSITPPPPPPPPTRPRPIHTRKENVCWYLSWAGGYAGIVVVYAGPAGLAIGDVIAFGTIAYLLFCQ